MNGRVGGGTGCHSGGTVWREASGKLVKRQPPGIHEVLECCEQNPRDPGPLHCAGAQCSGRHTASAAEAGGAEGCNGERVSERDEGEEQGKAEGGGGGWWRRWPHMGLRPQRRC